MFRQSTWVVSLILLWSCCQAAEVRMISLTANPVGDLTQLPDVVAVNGDTIVVNTLPFESLCIFQGDDPVTAFEECNTETENRRCIVQQGNQYTVEAVQQVGVHYLTVSAAFQNRCAQGRKVKVIVQQTLSPSTAATPSPTRPDIVTPTMAPTAAPTPVQQSVGVGQPLDGSNSVMPAVVAVAITGVAFVGLTGRAVYVQRTAPLVENERGDMVRPTLMQSFRNLSMYTGPNETKLVAKSSFVSDNAAPQEEPPKRQRRKAPPKARASRLFTTHKSFAQKMTEAQKRDLVEFIRANDSRIADPDGHVDKLARRYTKNNLRNALETLYGVAPASLR